jgi:hypothetical protein
MLKDNSVKHSFDLLLDPLPVCVKLPLAVLTSRSLHTNVVIISLVSNSLVVAQSNHRIGARELCSNL